MSVNSSPHQAAATTWIALAETLQAASVLREGSPQLVEYALDEFDPRVVIERLLSPEPTYFAHKDILFAGLSAWTVAPHDLGLVREAMILTGMSRLADLERERQEQFPYDPLLADIVSRLIGPGIDFYRDFYYPAGGLQRVLTARSPEVVGKSLAAASDQIGFQLEMMRVCHYHAVKLQDRVLFKRASFTSGAKAVRALLEKGLAGDIRGKTKAGGKSVARPYSLQNCARFCTPYNPSATLIYAASSISLLEGNLLDAMRAGKASFTEHGSLLQEWIGRAVYTSEKIIHPMYKRDSISEQTSFLPLIDPITIDLPAFGAGLELVESAFSTAKRRQRLHTSQSHRAAFNG